MAKIVKKTYGKKFAWETGSSHAFDEAKLQSSKSPPSKIIRPSIWAKVPLIESFTAESPPRFKKRAVTTTKQDVSDIEETIHTPKKGKKRKIQDPFGFGDIEDEVLPALEYISPKKKMALESAMGKKKSKEKKIKMKVSANSKKSSFKGDSVIAGSPKQKTSQAKKKIMPYGSSLLDPVHPKEFTNVPSPKKRGRPPKNSVASLVSPAKDKSLLKANGVASIPGSKKRGRPPKDSIESPLEQLMAISKTMISNENGASASPKKRGRPPKTSIQSPPVEKMKKISKALIPGKSIVSPSPKKRGRPPKNSIESPTNQSNTMSIGASVNKKSVSPSHTKKGRSSKGELSSPISPVKVNKDSINKKSPKKMGRASNKSSLSSCANGIADSPSPKKRGRPSKSLMSKSPYDRSLQDSHENLKSVKASVTPSPKKRGRPPKINHKSQTPLSSTSVKKEDPPQQMGSGRSGISPAPKRRGRPPKGHTSTSEKVPLPVQNDIVPSLDTGISKPKLPEDHVPPGKLKQEEQTLENVIQIIDKAPLIKKRRGRKPKNKLSIKNEVDSPDLSQETPHEDEPHLSVENTISSRQELNTDSTIDQTSSEDSSKKVRFPTDIVQDDTEIGVSSSKSSTTSATGVGCFTSSHFFT